MINRDYNITFLFFFIDVSTFTIEKKFCTITVEWIYYFFQDSTQRSMFFSGRLTHLLSHHLVHG